MERRFDIMSHAKWGGASSALGKKHQVRRARCGRRQDGCPGEDRAQTTAGLQAYWHSGKTARCAGENRREGGLWHPCGARRRKKRGPSTIACLRWPCEEDGRRRG